MTPVNPQGSVRPESSTRSQSVSREDRKNSADNNSHGARGHLRGGISCQCDHGRLVNGKLRRRGKQIFRKNTLPQWTRAGSETCSNCWEPGGQKLNVLEAVGTQPALARSLCLSSSRCRRHGCGVVAPGVRIAQRKVGLWRSPVCVCSSFENHYHPP